MLSNVYTSTPFACVRSLCLSPQHVSASLSAFLRNRTRCDIVWASRASRLGVSPCLVVWHGYRRQEACGCFIERFLRGVPFLFGLIGTSMGAPSHCCFWAKSDRLRRCNFRPNTLWVCGSSTIHADSERCSFNANDISTLAHYSKNQHGNGSGFSSRRSPRTEPPFDSEMPRTVT